jgi:hypothetical protein
MIGLHSGTFTTGGAVWDFLWLLSGNYSSRLRLGSFRFCRHRWSHLGLGSLRGPPKGRLLGIRSRWHLPYRTEVCIRRQSRAHLGTVFTTPAVAGLASISMHHHRIHTEKLMVLQHMNHAGAHPQAD